MSIFKSHIDRMSTYKPPLEGRNPAKYTLLDFNERTVPVSDRVARDIADWVMSGRMQMYPSYGDVTSLIAEYCSVDADNVMITNGSDQGIDLLFRATCEVGSEVIVPGPTFPMYLQSAMIENALIHEPQYTKEGGYPVAEVLALINEKTKVIVVSNPNNPCGTLLSREGVLSLAEAAPGAVILVDECYFEFCQQSVVDLVEQHPNIVVTRTFSKTWGLPSLRIGYVVAAKDNIEALLKVRGPYDINQLAIVAVQSAFRHREFVTEYIDEVMQRSKPLFEAFLRERMLSYWPSVANFIWVFFDNAAEMEQALRAAGILVRPKADSEGVVGLRVTLGTVEQTNRLMDAIEAAL